MTRETVAGDTPAARATALIVVAPDRDATGFSRPVCEAATARLTPSVYVKPVSQRRPSLFESLKLLEIRRKWGDLSDSNGE